MKLSVVIITFNEEKNIGRCLDSLSALADEIIVVDSFSTDDTELICKRHGVRFVQHAFGGHIEQKNIALDLASHPLILSLDADEALDNRLFSAIQEVKTEAKHDAYSMNRLTNYCGHWVHHTGWYPDTKIRLVQKSRARWGGENPHDRLELISGGSVAHLEGDILHYSYFSRADHLRQIEYFSGIAAKEALKKGKSSGWLLIGAKVFAQFVKSFIIKAGFLDGRTGWNISWLSAYATYRKYWKIKQLQNGKSIS